MSQGTQAAEHFEIGQMRDDTPDPSTTGPIHSVVSVAGGRRYLTDEFHHRLIIEERSGARRATGGPGRGIGEFLYPRGLAILPGLTAGDTRLYVCDAWNHRVQVLDGDGKACSAFGEQGCGPGQFDVPTDVAIVRPQFPGEDLDENDDTGAMVAVADRWNCRIQVFDLDGAYVANFGVRAAEPGNELDTASGFTRSGWPFFRVGHHPVVWFPIRLAWSAPRLNITCANDRVISVDLASAILPDFDDWRRTASETELSAAQSRFRALESGGDVLPASMLAQIETDLGRRLLARGLVTSVHLLWTTPWPNALSRNEIDRVFESRMAVLMSYISTRSKSDKRRQQIVKLAAQLVRAQTARGWTRPEPEEPMLRRRVQQELRQSLPEAI